MRKPKRPIRLRVEGLEQRVVLSGGASRFEGVEGLLRSMNRLGAVIQRAANPSFRAAYTVHPNHVDAGTTYMLRGRARILGVPARLEGSITAPGFTPEGRPSGLLSVTTAEGTTTLRLQGTPRPGGAGLKPVETFRFVVVESPPGTEPAGSGTVEIRLAPQIPRRGPFAQPNPAPTQGRAQVTIHVELTGLGLG